MKTEKEVLMRTLVLGIGIFFVLLIGIWAYSLHIHIEDIAVHSVLETAGAILLLTFAYYIFKFDSDTRFLSRFHYISLAFITIGILDLFHAISPSFKWLHTSSLLLGGFVLMLVFLPEKKVSKNSYNRLPLFLTALSIIVAISLYFTTNFLPPEVINGSYSKEAIYARTLASISFIIASFYFANHYRKE